VSICFVIIERESFKPESVAYKTGFRDAASTIKRRQHRASYVASKDVHGFQRSLPREVSRHHSVADEELYCPMDGVRANSIRRQPTTNSGHAVQNTPVNLYRACSDETLSLHSHSRRLQRTHHDASRPTPVHVDRRMSAVDITTNSANHESHGRRERHRRTVVPQSVMNTSSGKSRSRTVVNNRPDLLCTWKDYDEWKYVSPVSCGAVDFSGQRHSSPQDDDLHAGTNETVNGTHPATTQSPQSIVSDGSPRSQYPIAPAASPVTLNSVVFTPPPCTLVSSSTTTVCPTTSYILPRPLMVDSWSNTDSGYGSKIYRRQGTGQAVDPVTSCREHLARPVETGVNLRRRICSSIPDVVVGQPPYHSGQVVPAATLPRTAFDHNVSSGRQLYPGDAGSPPLNLHLMTYSETNLVVSPCRTDRRQSRVPIELADENSAVEIGKTFSPMSPLSLDSVDFLAEKLSDCILSSPATDASVTTVPTETTSSVPQTAELISSAHVVATSEQLYCNVNSVAETDNQLVCRRSLSNITEDAQLSGEEYESYVETDDYHRLPLPAEGSFNHVSGTVDSSQVKDEVVRYQLASDVKQRCLQIGRCTTV